MSVLIGTNTAEAHPVIASRMKRAQKLFGQKYMCLILENMKWLNAQIVLSTETRYRFGLVKRSDEIYH